MSFDPSNYQPSSLVAMSKNAGKHTADMAKASAEDGFLLVTCPAVPPDELWFIEPSDKTFYPTDKTLTIVHRYTIVSKITGIGRDA